MKPLMIGTLLLGLATSQASAGNFFEDLLDLHKKHVRLHKEVVTHVARDVARAHRDVHVAVTRPVPAPRRAPVECCDRVWVAGHYETIQERVWVPAHRERVRVEAVYEVRRDHCGRPYRVLVRPASVRWAHVPGHYETTSRQVWHEGYWETRCTTSGHRHHR